MSEKEESDTTIAKRQVEAATTRVLLMAKRLVNSGPLEFDEYAEFMLDLRNSVIDLGAAETELSMAQENDPAYQDIPF